MTDWPSALPGSPPSRQWSALLVSARKYAQPSWSTWPALRSVASGLTIAAARERQLQRRAERRHLVGRGLDHLLLAPRAVEVGLGRVEPVLADPRVDERPLPVHVLRALARSASPPTSWQRAVGRVRAVEAVGEDRPGNVDVDAADRVDQLLEAVEVDEGDVVDVEARQALHRLQRRAPGRRSANAALIFAVPCPGMSTRRSRGIERNASRCFPGSVRISMIESERLRVSAARLGAAVGAEHEDRRRGRRRAARPGVVSSREHRVRARARSRPRCRCENER